MTCLYESRSKSPKYNKNKDMKMLTTTNRCSNKRLPLQKEHPSLRSRISSEWHLIKPPIPLGEGWSEGNARRVYVFFAASLPPSSQPLLCPVGTP